MLTIPDCLIEVYLRGKEKDCKRDCISVVCACYSNQAAAPKVIACGTFALTAPSSTSSFTGTLPFTVTNSILGGLSGLTIPGVNGAPAEQVTGTILTPPNGALFVSFSGTSPVRLFGSFASPSFSPHHPSTQLSSDVQRSAVEDSSAWFICQGKEPKG